MMWKWITAAIGSILGGAMLYKMTQKPGVTQPGKIGPVTPFKPISQPTDTSLADAFIQSKNFTPAARGSAQIDWIVIHTMENGEIAGQARNVANWFANAFFPKDPAPKASVHYCVDNAEIIQTLQEKNIAWGAAGANDNGVHIEHAGRAAQSPGDWQDKYSIDEMEKSAQLSADICQRNGIEPRFLSAQDLLVKPRLKGFTGHINVNEAFKMGDHTDPGPNFPWDYYLGRVNHYLGGSGNV